MKKIGANSNSQRPFIHPYDHAEVIMKVKFFFFLIRADCDDCKESTIRKFWVLLRFDTAKHDRLAYVTSIPMVKREIE